MTRLADRMRTAAIRTLGIATLAAGLALPVHTGSVRAETLVTSLSTHQLAITSNYAGSQIVLFGAVQRDAQTLTRVGSYDAAVIVRGPKQVVTVREKERVGPIWLNRSQQKFENVPTYYAVLASRPIDEVTSPEIRQRLSLGLEALVASPDLTGPQGQHDMTPFRDALGRLKAREGLFFEVDRGVTFLTPSIFRSAIALPANAPPGNYAVEVLLFADGVLLARDNTDFELVKVGLEQRLARMSETNPAFYGLMTASMALFFGWLASIIFRRD